ncbi:dTDP-4-dehydrorhamnose reductase [Octadecabacter sp. CECT 8868]|uniref:dTDP-4-dehydrorhamnose reductase n=1 Tax=Octadecabacter algicola TaxID=2909342 RepID=UPI001F29F9EC|nr:dTDP-4-dehydrorhamnose reductase [Octadecabacter algicola]MCF2906711.1 dTDP-4-dehydrorhamnose reductase [Octadecabacter algicola]
MSVLVFGKTGQVASELAALAPNAQFLSRAEADLADPQACADIIAKLRPTAVINAAAYTAVDRAEENEDEARVINGDSPAAMAVACKALDVPFVHISTDYVFDGEGQGAFRPVDPTGPASAYGRTKLVGEDALRDIGGRYAILRTSWVFSAHGNNFLKTMLRLGAERDSLTIVADQIGGPTPAASIAQTCLTMAEALAVDPSRAGTYHLSGAPDASWADFAREIFTCAGLSTVVEDIPTSAYPTPAVRPLNSRLDNASLLAQFGVSRPDWKAATAAIVKELKS